MVDCVEVGAGSAVGRYTIQREAGQGTFCKVWWAQDTEGRPYAVKVFGKTVLDHKYVAFFDQNGATTVPLRERIDEEVRLLRLLQHEGVLRLEEVLDDQAYGELFVVLEGLPGGQLMTWSDDLPGYNVVSDAQEVRQHWGDAVRCEASGSGVGATVFQEAVAALLFRQLLLAVVYLHAHGVIHKDLKPDNILLTSAAPALDPRFCRLLSLERWPDVPKPCPVGLEAEAAGGVAPLLQRFSFAAKIGDFNSAAQGNSPSCHIYDAEGTTAFTPPECFDIPRGGIPGKPRDMWSLGCVLFVMLYGRCPYWASEAIMLQLSIMSDDFATPSGILSSSAEDLVKKLLARDAGDRPTASEALEHAWLRDAGA